MGNGVLNPAYTFPSRYPNAMLTFPPDSNQLPELDMVIANATLDASEWEGHLNGYIGKVSPPPDPTNFVVQQEAYPYSNVDTYIPGSLIEQAPGVFWYLDQSYDGTNRTGEIRVYKGVFNALDNQVDWNLQQTFNPNFHLGYNGLPHFAGLHIAFGPSSVSHIGYIAMLGDLVGGGRFCVFSDLYEND